MVAAGEDAMTAKPTVAEIKFVDIYRNAWRGKTAWILGKGPSIQWLRSHHFGAGPIIAINHAILAIQDMDLPVSHPILNLQKDGCSPAEIGPHHCNIGTGVFQAVYPRPEITVVLQHPGFSQYCLADHPRRLFVDPMIDLVGMRAPEEMSIRMAIGMASVAGAERVVLLCCDSITRQDDRYYDIDHRRASMTDASNHYGPVAPIVKSDLEKFGSHQFITPEECHE